MPPLEVIEILDLQEGMTITDIGSGTGFFALPFARAVGAEGRIRAVDLQAEMVEILRSKLSDPGAPSNVTCSQGTAHRTGLPDRSCDLAFLGNLWHELDGHGRVLEEVARILRPGGRIAILDWRKNVSQPPGPPLDHRVESSEVERSLLSRGWTNIGFCLVGKYSYLVTASPSG